MKPIAASVEAQIDALLEDRIEALFGQYGLGQAALVDMHRYLTITRSDLLTYFTEHPGSADAFLVSHARDAHDDEIGLQRTEAGYVVWTTYHGAPAWVRTFLTADGAVAEFLLAITGRLTHGDR